jgi:hypothetical protein
VSWRFSDALRQEPEEASQFLFHIHGPAGVGKSTLVRQREGSAREQQAVSAQCAQQGHRFPHALGSRRATALVGGRTEAKTEEYSIG